MKTDERCPKCGGELKFDEKDTSSGRDWRSYRCVNCGAEHIEDRGPALWKILSDAREAKERADARRLSLPPKPLVRLRHALRRFFGR